MSQLPKHHHYINYTNTILIETYIYLDAWIEIKYIPLSNDVYVINENVIIPELSKETINIVGRIFYSKDIKEAMLLTINPEIFINNCDVLVIRDKKFIFFIINIKKTIK